MAITYNNLYLDIRQQLRRAGIEAATLEARELVCFGTDKTRDQLPRDGSLYASPEVEARVRDLVDRHLAGEPVAYLIGEWEFYGLPLDISRDVLIPRPDTEVLVEQALEYLKPLGQCRVLDLCAGSGCIGLAVAANAPDSRVLLGEISEPAVRAMYPSRCSMVTTPLNTLVKRVLRAVTRRKTLTTAPIVVRPCRLTTSAS